MMASGARNRAPQLRPSAGDGDIQFPRLKPIEMHGYKRRIMMPEQPTGIWIRRGGSDPACWAGPVAAAHAKAYVKAGAGPRLRWRLGVLQPQLRLARKRKTKFCADFNMTGVLGHRDE